MSQEALDRLLGLLDSNPEIASRKCEMVRNKLTRFFWWRGLSTPEEYADRTIEQVARALIDGVRVETQNPYLYFHSVAIDMLKVQWKQRDQNPPEVPPSNVADQEPGQVELQKTEWERQVQCLEQCVTRLTHEDLDLITKYHQRDEALNKVTRKDLARSLSIPQNALRLRAFRIRNSIESCVTDCLGRSR